ncbi:NADH-quinone oxidoreductase subunit H [bacterium]|nr:NADH-quinone oxidoreductase subunit H [bacterium]
MIHPILSIILAPFLFGVINKTKAFFAGRTGQPVFQPYFDLLKLLRKGAVYSRTTTWIFRASPLIGLISVIIAVYIISGVLSFDGDIILFVYLLGLMRFFTIIAALDTGSSFEGMGASRESWFGLLAEPVLFLALFTLIKITGCLSLSEMLGYITPQIWNQYGYALVLITAAILIVFLVENSRIPIDDPNTHLELTMIHEVMVLDHSGIDFAFILYSTALKFWVLGALLVGIVVPVHTGKLWIDTVSFLGGMLGVAVVVGVIESVMARLRLLHVPQVILAAGIFSLVALIFVVR